MEFTNMKELFIEFNNSLENEEGFTEKCICLAKAIIEKKTTIPAVVENLGTLLVNSLPEQRELGTLILTQILENIPDDFLTSTELHFITSFYSDRMKDHHKVIPAVLRGIVALVKMKHLPEGAPHILLTALFDNISCQTQQLQERQCIYEIFKRLLDNRNEEIKAMDSNFVLSFIQAMDGERDPRILFGLFNWLPHFFRNVQLKHLTEEMFDVISCYFPIDFRIPVQDKQSVTREDLAASLRPCLCALPEFAEFCLPLLIDKLSSSLTLAKYDALQLLTQSCKTFDASIYQQYSHDLWNILQKEILNSTDSELEEASLHAVSAIINRLSTADNEHFTETVNNLYGSLKGNLRPDTKFFLAASKILLAVARASKKSCDIIVLPTVSLLINQFKLTKNTANQEVLFRTLMEFTVAYLKIHEICDISKVEVLQEVVVLCLDLTSHPEPEIRAIGFENIGRLAKSVSLGIREVVCDLLHDKMLQNDSAIVRSSYLKCLTTFCSLYSEEIRTKMFTNSTNINGNNSELYFEVLYTMISEHSFISIILNIFLENCTSTDSVVSKSSTKWFLKLLEDNPNNKNLQDFLYSKCNALSLITTWILTNINNNWFDFELLTDISGILKSIVGFQPAEQQTLIIKLYLNDFLTLFYSNDALKNKVLIILEGLLLRVRSDVEIPDKHKLILNLLTTSLITETNLYSHTCMLIANILNKCDEDENFSHMLNESYFYLFAVLQNNPNDLEIQNAILLTSWITKSLIVKGSDKSYLWTDKLISLLNDHEEAGKGFRLIMDDSHDCLSSKCYCTNRLLYRQKFFAYVCKKLSKGYNKSKVNYLVALGYLLQLVPQQVIILYFKETLRLLMFCLELCKDPEALGAVLSTLCTLIETKEESLESHLDALLPKFLKLTKFQHSMKVRIIALKCIQKIPANYPVYKLLPLKQSVIFGLNASLDDKKRLVRNQAVTARSCWFLLDAPM